MAMTAARDRHAAPGKLTAPDGMAAPDGTAAPGAPPALDGAATPDGPPGWWRTLGERTIHQDPYVWFGQMDVRAPDSERFWYNVIRMQRVALMALVDDRDRVLMLWRHRFIADRWGWELPGGLVDDGEDPATAAARELTEETGYRAGRARHLITFQPAPGRADNEHWAFLGHDPHHVGGPVDVNEAARVEWIPLAAIGGLIAAGEIWNGGILVPLLHLLALGGAAGPA